MPAEECEVLFVISNGGIWWLIHDAEFGRQVTEEGDRQIQEDLDKRKAKSDKRLKPLHFKSTKAYDTYIQPAVKDPKEGYLAFLRETEERNRQAEGRERETWRHDDIKKQEEGASGVFGVFWVGKTGGLGRNVL